MASRAERFAEGWAPFSVDPGYCCVTNIGQSYPWVSGGALWLRFTLTETIDRGASRASAPFVAEKRKMEQIRSSPSRSIVIYDTAALDLDRRAIESYRVL
jgi:hypothetical protein